MSRWWLYHVILYLHVQNVNMHIQDDIAKSSSQNFYGFRRDELWDLKWRRWVDELLRYWETNEHLWIIYFKTWHHFHIIKFQSLHVYINTKHIDQISMIFLFIMKTFFCGHKMEKKLATWMNLKWKVYTRDHFNVNELLQLICWQKNFVETKSTEISFWFYSYDSWVMIPNNKLSNFISWVIFWR